MGRIASAVLAGALGLAPSGVDGQDAGALALEHLEYVEQAYTARQGPDAASFRSRVKADEAALDRSLDWLIADGRGEQALRFAVAMNPFWTAFGEVPKAMQRLHQILAMPAAAPPTALRARVLYDFGLHAFRANDERASRSANEESLSISRGLNDTAAVATALIGLSRLSLRGHDYGAVRRQAGEARRLRQQIADVQGEMAAVHMLAAAARMEGDHAAASKFYELTLGLYSANGNKAGVAGELMNLAYVHLHQHDAEWAQRLFTQGLSMYRDLRSPSGLALSVGGFAAVAAEQRRARRAARLYGALDSALQRLGVVLDPDDQMDFDRYSAMARKQIGASDFEQARAEGRSLTVDAALDVAQER